MKPPPTFTTQQIREYIHHKEVEMLIKDLERKHPDATDLAPLMTKLLGLCLGSYKALSMKEALFKVYQDAKKLKELK